MTKVRYENRRPPGDGMLPYLVPPPPAPGNLFHYQQLRAALPPDSPLHAVLGPLEHGQFAEDAVRDNPLMAVPMSLAIPAYTAGKAAGLVRGTRSPASWDEIFEAYKGLWRGMLPQPRPRD